MVSIQPIFQFVLFTEYFFNSQGITIKEVLTKKKVSHYIF